MPIQVFPIALPTSADLNQWDSEFGREVKGANLVGLSRDEFSQLEGLLYTVR